MNEPSEQGVRETYAAFVAAMPSGDTDRLGALLDQQFTLTHITGYRQPREEWLSEMRQGRFVYHNIAPRSTSISVNGQSARIVARTLTDATVYGSRNDWRLQLDIRYAWRAGAWVAYGAVATTW